MPRQRKPVIDRFLPKVLLIPNGCWLWLGSTCRQTGYSKFFYDDEVGSGHRFAYRHFVGAIQDGLELDHLCRNRACVNPYHLEPVTPTQNKERGDNNHRGQWQRETTHCPQGHAYDETNTWRSRDGRRFCRACNRERMRARRALAC